MYTDGACAEIYNKFLQTTTLDITVTTLPRTSILEENGKIVWKTDSRNGSGKDDDKMWVKSAKKSYDGKK